MDPATSPSLHEGTGRHTKRSGEQVAASCAKNSSWFEFVGLIAGTKAWSMQLDSEAKNGQFTQRDLYPQRVADLQVQSFHQACGN